MRSLRANKGIVLLSGGCDSATCLGVAVDELGAENVHAMSIVYGQKHSKELECAKSLAEHYGIKHDVVDISDIGLFDGSDCTLLEGNGDIPHESYADQQTEGGVSTYVPFRNGLFLSMVAARAVSIDGDSDWRIYIGAHSDDAAGDAYADCSSEFCDAMYKAISIGTYGKVNVCAPFVGLHKADVVAKGLELGVPYEHTWSCYEGGDIQCGTCGTCIDRKAAFDANGAVDPVPYKE